MIKLEQKRARNKLSSVKALRDHCAYLADSSNKDHIGKTLVAPVNHWCNGNSIEEFIKECTKARETFAKARKGKPGRPSNRLWEEVIYSTPYGARPTRAARDAITALLIQEIAPDSAARSAWHLDERSGRADLHIIIAAKTTGYPPSTTLWETHGKRDSEHLLAHFNRIDDEIADFTGVKSASKTRKDKLRKEGIITDDISSLADHLSRLPIAITPEILQHAIRTMGHKVTKISKRSISIIWKKRKQARRYNIEKLLGDIKEIKKNTPAKTPKIAPSIATTTIDLKSILTPKTQVIPPSIAIPQAKAMEEPMDMEMPPLSISKPRKRIKPPELPRMS